MRRNYNLLIVILTLTLLLSGFVSDVSASDFAQRDETEKEHCVQGIDYESLDALKANLLLNAKRFAVNELFGELIATSTAVENFVLTNDQIRASSLGLVRIDGEVDYYNGTNLADVCIYVSAYTTKEDRLQFEPVKLNKRNCVTEQSLTTRELTEFAKQQAIIQALLDYDRKLQQFSEDDLLQLMQRVNYTESGFVPETETYCTRVEGYVTPIEVLTLLEVNLISGSSIRTAERVVNSNSKNSLDNSNTVVLKPITAVSFQDEGTAGFDDTQWLIEQDDVWGPSVVGSVKNDYYATGNGKDWFDAISINFDVTGFSIDTHTPILRFYAQHGSYRDSFWQHYLLQKGKENQLLNDTVPPTKIAEANTIDYTSGKWIEAELPKEFWAEDSLWLTLRLWNVRVDAIEMYMKPLENSQISSVRPPNRILDTKIISPTVVLSFQDEGTAGIDDTELFIAQDDRWAPTLSGSVRNDYYATGNGSEWFDALSAKFDLAGLERDAHKLKLRFYAQHGGYRDNFWNHYILQRGKENQADNDSVPPTKVSGTKTIDFSAGKWIEVDVPQSYWADNELWLTLRLWNIRVDALQLSLIPIRSE